MTVQIYETSIQNGPLPIGPKVGYGFNPTTGCVFMTRLESQLNVPINDDWGFVHGKAVAQGITVDASYLYALCNNVVYRFSLTTGLRHDTGFSCTELMLGATALASDTTYLYVAGVANVVRFNKATGTVDDSGFACSLVIGNPVAISVDSNYVYVATKHAVHRYSKTTGVVDTVGFSCIEPGADILDATVSGSYLYTLTATAVLRFDKGTGTANTTAFACTADIDAPAGLLVVDSYIYVADSASGHVVRYDVATGAENVTLFTGKALTGNKGRLCADSNYIYAAEPASTKVARLNLDDGAVNVEGFEYAQASITDSGLVTHTLAPYPPAFYDRNWYEPLPYVQDTSYVSNGVKVFHIPYNGSLADTSTPDMKSVVGVLVDQFQTTRPSVYNVGLITQETADRQLLWRVKTVSSGGYVMDIWYSSEAVYKYKAGGIYFGGKDYTGPLSTVLVDPGTGQVGESHAILDLNEFPVNADNETFVHASCCNYSNTDSRVYCVLDKSTGRMAEIRVASLSVQYFTLLVPADSVIYQVYYTGRLMYTTYNSITGDFCLYDAHNNGTLLYTFDVGTFDPAVVPQFSVIN